MYCRRRPMSMCGSSQAGEIRASNLRFHNWHLAASLPYQALENPVGRVEFSAYESVPETAVFPRLRVLDTLGIGLYKPPTFRQAVSFQYPSARLAPRSKKLKRC